MGLLFSTNMLFVLLTSFWPLWFSARILRLPFINPISIPFFVTVPVVIATLFVGPYFLVENGFFDIGYQFAIAMMSVSNIFTAMGVCFFYKISKAFKAERYLPFKGVKLTRRDLMRSEIILFIFFVFFFYLLASKEFGLINWILDPRTGYQFYRTGQGHWYALAMSFLSAAFTCGVISSKDIRGIIGRFLLYVPFCFLFGSKAFLLSLFIFLVIYLWFMNWKRLKFFVALGVPFIFMVMLINFFYSSVNVQAEEVFNYFDYYKNAADYYRLYLAGGLNLFYGEVLFSSLWEYVPRGVWPDKPHVYGGILVADIFYPEAAENTHFPAFGGAVMNFADFGVFGVAILGFLSSQALVTGVLSYLVFRRNYINHREMSLLSVMIILIFFSPQFGMFFPGLLYFLVLGSVLIVIRLMRIRSGAFIVTHSV